MTKWGAFEVGNGIFTSPAKPMKARQESRFKAKEWLISQVNSKERWMPKVSQGGFSNLDTASLIAGQGLGSRIPSPEVTWTAFKRL